MMRTLYTTILLLISCLTFSQTAVQQVVSNPLLKHASVGISVVDISAGKTIVSYNAEKSLTPASIQKLITTATAVEALGDNYRYRTEVALDDNDPSRLLVIGSGDPTLG